MYTYQCAAEPQPHGTSRNWHTAGISAQKTTHPLLDVNRLISPNICQHPFFKQKKRKYVAGGVLKRMRETNISLLYCPFSDFRRVGGCNSKSSKDAHADVRCPCCTLHWGDAHYNNLFRLAGYIDGKIYYSLLFLSIFLHQSNKRPDC